MVERCKQCNGIISISRNVAYTMIDTTIKPAAWCKCPEVKHDGRLEGRNPYLVEHIDIMNVVHDVRIGHGAAYTEEHGAIDEVWLSAKQALSLLEWLQQEKETLEKLALDVD